ncbi:MAG: hypothetical protein ACO37H_01920 [Burkholderiaceae bacterium]
MNEWSAPGGMATIGTPLLMAALMPAMLGLWLRWSRTELLRWVSPGLGQSASQLSLGWAVLASLVGLLIGLLAQSLSTSVTLFVSLALILLVSGLMAASRIDLLTQLLPNRITRGLLAMGLTASLLPGWPTTLAASRTGRSLAGAWWHSSSGPGPGARPKMPSWAAETSHSWLPWVPGLVPWHPSPQWALGPC